MTEESPLRLKLFVFKISTPKVKNQIGITTFYNFKF